MRDTQRSRVYSAESALVSSPNNKRYPTLLEIEKYLSRVTQTKWFQKRFRSIDITLADGRGCRWARCWNGAVTTRLVLPKWARSTYVILHELSHGVQPRPSAAHGPEFCGVFLALVRKFMSKEDAALLEKRFRERRVMYYDLNEMSEIRRRLLK